MNWRKWNRWLHREIGFLFFGMSIIYGVSGIALNHFVTRDWDPGIVTRTETLEYPGAVSKEQADADYVREILELCGQEKNYKQYYFPSDEALMIYLNGGHILVELQSGKAHLTQVRKRQVFSQLNYLHYNKAKRLWTWFSDLYALGLVLLAISGVYMVKGKKGIRGRNGLLFAAGILIPLAFLLIYMR